MKKIIYTLLTPILFAIMLLGGCGSSKQDIKFYVPDGGPLLTVTKLMSDNKQFANHKVSYNRISGTEVEAKLESGQADIAIAPINLCARAYNKNQNYVLAGVSVWGNSYIVSSQDVLDLSDLNGEVIYAFQEMGTPGITLKAILSMYDIDYKVITQVSDADSKKVNLIFLSAAGNVVAEMDKINSSVKFALLPEPTTTAKTMGNNNFNVAFDLQYLWKEQTGESYPQAGLVIKKSLIKKNIDFVNKFISEIQKSSKYTLDNPENAATLAKTNLQSGALPGVPVIKKFIETSGQDILQFSNINQSKDIVSAYLQILYTYNHNVIGGSVPDDSFYMN